MRGRPLPSTIYASIAAGTEAKLRTYTSFMYQANSWARPRKVVARLECSLQPDTGGEITSTGMRGSRRKSQTI
jgi:hypothetical protein